MDQLNRIETPKSSNIRYVEYDYAASDLSVTFKNGSEYRYSLVPKHLFESFATVDSAGKFFIANIKDHFKCIKVKGPSQLKLNR